MKPKYKEGDLVLVNGAENKIEHTFYLDGVYKYRMSTDMNTKKDPRWADEDEILYKL